MEHDDFLAPEGAIQTWASTKLAFNLVFGFQLHGRREDPNRTYVRPYIFLTSITRHTSLGLFFNVGKCKQFSDYFFWHGPLFFWENTSLSGGLLIFAQRGKRGREGKNPK